MRLSKYIAVLSFLLFLIIEFQLFAQSKSVGINTVVIDAGHGGKDPGAVSKTLKEKDITLSVALKLGELIKKNFRDVKVVYTRTTDEFIELFKRAKIANAAHADLFISIHVNSNKKTDPSGSETYVMGLSKTNSNLEVAMTENSVILKEDDYKNQYDGFDPHSPEAYIIFSLYQNANMDLSLTFSSMIQEEYKKNGRYDRGVKQAGFLVLWKTMMPSVLTEIGFISNPDDEAFLGKEENKWLIAKSIFNAFSKYKGQIEGKNYITLSSSDLPKLEEKEKRSPNSVQDIAKVVKTDTAKKEINNEVKMTDKNDSTSINKVDFQKVAENIVNNDTIYFWVQLASSDKRIPLNQFKVENVKEMYWNKLYKYLCGQTKLYQEVIEKQKEVKKQYPGAFVVATKNGEKIPLNDAIKQTKN